MEEVKRIAQLLIPDASASFQALIYIFFLCRLAPPDPSIFSASRRRDRRGDAARSDAVV